MSRRDHRNRSGAAVASGGGQEIERLLAKGRVKDAFKQAKLAFRQQPTPENRRLLERTYLLRVKDLLRGGLPDAAAEVARGFLELGVSEPDDLGELAAILPQLGMVEEARRLAPRLQSSAAAASLEHSLVDQAVLHPERATTPEVKTGAERIRSALAALDAEQEPRAMELLQDIGRNSPWADWRYFVRGLAAYRRGDATQADANFNRLDQRRAARRIATRLGAAAAAVNQQSSAEVDASALETAVFGQPVLARLQRVRRLVDRVNPKHDWKQALPLIASLTSTLRRLDARLAERLTGILIPPLFDELASLAESQAQRLLESFSRSAAPLRLDPSWNRLRALCYEEAAGPDDAIPFWKEYLRDLDGVADLPAEERRRIQALVWWHVGILLDAETDNEAPSFFEQTHPESTRLREGALRAFEESLRIDPSLRESYASLISLFEQEELPERVAEVQARLLATFPDDLDALKALIAWHRLQDEPERCLEYTARARKLRPLDTALIEDEHSGFIALARHHALAGRFDEASAAFARAEALDAAASAEYSFVARRAVCEWKAGRRRDAEEWIEKAQSALSNAAPLWLALTIEAERYKLDPSCRSHFNRQLASLLKKKKSGEAAAELARLVCSYHSVEVEYGEKQHHLEAVSKYVLATSRTHYAMRDLEQVCMFLDIFHGKEPLLARLIRRGLKDYPRSPVFPFLKASRDLRDMPTKRVGFQRIGQRLRQALDLAQADADGHYARWVDPIKHQIATVERLSEMMGTMRRGFGPGGGFPGSMPAFFRMMESFLGPDGDDPDDSPFDDDFFEPPFSFVPPNRGQRRKK